MFKKVYSKLALAVCLLVSVGSYAEADTLTNSADVTAKMTVLQKLQIQKNSDLVFANAEVGAAAQILNPSDTGAASFTVSGEKNRNFQVSYSDTSIFMTTGDGSTQDKKIKVDAFTTDLSSTNGTNPAGTLSETGKKDFKLGATRAKLSDTQVTGDYNGTVKLTVNYF